MSLAVYIHIPFCERKCNYCDFTSYPVAGQAVDAYLEALAAEMAMYRKQISDRPVQSLFIGGGTPSILGLPQLERLLRDISHNFAMAKDAEVSIEANPGSLQRRKLEVLREAGVNRLSLGVQSLHPQLLKELGRIHTPNQAIESYQLARQAGFDNINLDLMNGLPGQSLKDWQDTLRQAAALKPEHLSVYGLSIEDDTPFGRAYAKGELQLPEEEERAEMLEWTYAFLAQKGYNHYEISNYAIPGKECCHNKIYWLNAPYLGFGAGAVSYWQGERRNNLTGVAEYIQQINSGTPPVGERERADQAGEMAETVFLGLRLLSGLSRQRFAKRFEREIDEVYGPQIEELCTKGLLQDCGYGIRLTQRGILLANEVFCEFLP